jgi:SprT protein
MEYTDRQLQEAAQRVANVYARVVNRKLGCKIPVPVKLTFELEHQSLERARYAGMAHATMVIDLNMTLFRENVSEILNDTIPHEIAHLVQFDKFDLKGVSTPGHGVHWQEAMRIMGKTPKKCHSFNVSNAVAAYKKFKKEKAKKEKKS